MKSKKTLVLIGTAVLIVIAAIVTILAVTNKGHRVIKVESFKGKVTLERDDSEKDIFKDMNLKSEDMITTGVDGSIGLLVDDDKNIAAVENTCFEIISKGNAKKGALKIELKYGTSLIEIENKLSDGSSFKVETPNASLSVKGTTFEVTYRPEVQTTILKVTKGRVEAKTKEKTEMVKAGEVATIKGDNIEVSKSDDTDNDNNNNNSNNNNNNNQGASTGLVDRDDWAKLLKGGSDCEQLEYLLELASRCEYEKETDYLKNALYWMSVESFGVAPLKPIESLSTGEEVYEVVALNKIFSFLTDDIISEENLNPDINRLEGEKLICKRIKDSTSGVASAAIIEAYFVETGEIVIEYAFNVVSLETMDVERFRKKAFLKKDETGKYVLDHIEENPNSTI